ncbi:MAG: molybdopterin cofactor-binding domain-containing protein [Sphaerochaetaceae bacterium]
MAEQLNKPSTLYGYVITSSIDSGSIIGVSLPKKESEYFLLGPKDIPGENRIEVFNSEFPLFGSAEISYKGQPLFALFGPDREAVQVLAKQVEIDYQLEVDIDSEKTKFRHEPIVYQWGDPQHIELEDHIVVEKSYTDRRMQSSQYALFHVKTYLEDDLLNIEVPTQWPFHVRDTVASLCNRTQKSVIVYPQNHYSAKDERVLLPSIYASIAALATVKTGATVHMSNVEPTYKSEISVDRKTVIDSSGKPHSEEVIASVDCGAFPLFAEEGIKQMLAGLVPLYPLQAFKAEVHITESHTPPSHFFGDIGYSSALFSTEAHASAISLAVQQNPLVWRMKHYGETKNRNHVLQTPPIASLRNVLEATSHISNFSRHYGAYELQKKNKTFLSTFPNYSRGIAISSGAGISGFSSDSLLHGNAKISITLDSHNKVIVNTSFYPHKKLVSLWKATIAEQLSIETDTIDFVKNNTAMMVDSGPEVLSLDVKQSIMVIHECCKSIASRRFQDPLPLTESVTVKSVLTEETSLFASANWGAIIVELEVNTVTLEVEARKIWGRFNFDNPPDIDALELKIRHTIHASLSESGIVALKKEGPQPLIDVAVESFGEKKVPSSATSAIRGMVISACVSALSQALNKEIKSIPITSDDIMQAMKRSKE